MLVVEIVILVLVVVFITLLYLLRDRIGTIRYGTYSDRTPTCVRGGNCIVPGVSVTVSECIPNPETGYGCDDGNGRQTFASKISRSSCQPSCQKSEWSNQFFFPCATTDPCTNSGIGTAYVTQTCRSLDASGFEGCVLTGTDAELTQYALQPGCRRSGAVVICEPGSIVTVTQSCILEGVSQCGEWVTTDGGPCHDTIEVYTGTCLKDDGTPYTHYLDLFALGHINQPMSCVDGNGNPAQCLAIPCTNTDTLANVGNVFCESPYSCIKRCRFFSSTLPGVPNMVAPLVGKFFTIQDIISQGYMTSVHSLCGSTSLYGTPDSTDFGDCLASQNATVNPVEIGLFRPDLAVDLPTIYQISPDCTEEEIILNTALIVTAKPLGTNGTYHTMSLYAFLEGRIGIIDNTWHWNPNLLATPAIIGVQWPGMDQTIYDVQTPIVIDTIDRTMGRTSTNITSIKVNILDDTGEAASLHGIRKQRNCSLLFKSPIPANY